MISYRNATLPELNQILDWAAEEGWNPGLDDAATFFSADPNGFFVAVDGSDSPVASISIVNHTDSFAFLGLYIVRPEHRGRGIGLGLWQHAIVHAGNRTVGLDGVEAQQDNYVASGFAHAGGTTRYSGMITGREDPDIRAATPADIPELIAKEAEESGVVKTGYLTAWFAQGANRITLVLDGPQEIAGFCTVRACRDGAKIGPLVADDKDAAHRLLGHAAQIFGGPTSVDVPETAFELVALCEGHQLSAGFKTARMYRNAFVAPKPPVFAVTSLELG